MSDYEDKELFFFHGYPIRCNVQEASDYEYQIKAWPLAMELDELQARLEWSYRNGTEDRVAELDRLVQEAGIKLYDKIKRWAIYHKKNETV